MSHLLFFFLFFFPNFANSINPLLQDAKTLTFFTKNLSSPLYTFQNWNFSDPNSVCNWTGITCRGPRVAAINLSNQNISGTVSLAGLDQLQNLSLAGNNLGGSLSLFGFPNLRHLNISGNQFSGDLNWDYNGFPNLEVFDAYDNNFTAQLPIGVSNLPNLRYLDLGGNFFYGEIPSSYGEMLGMESLSLTGNDLRGKIPAQIGNLSALNYLYLGYFNQFEGGIPEEIGNLANLVHLDISSCGIDGIIPAKLGNLINLDTIYLHSNGLAGTIPAAMGNLTKLINFDLSNNALTGEIPREFDGLAELRLFNLFMNRLHGSIPEFFAELPELESLELFMNNFTGVIPQKLGLNGKLQLLDLSSNKLTGTIPEDLCPSNHLKVLILFKNFLFGSIPEKLGHCLSLIRVRLGENYLNGTVPLGLIYLPQIDLIELQNNYVSGPISENSNPNQRKSQLTVLNLSNNLLSGPIPNSISNLTFLETLILRQNLITGKIPSTIASLQKAEKIDFSRNAISGPIPAQIGKCTHLTYLDLSGNNLSGEIPAEIAGAGVLSYLNLSRNNLSDSIPNSINSISSLTAADFSFNNLSGELPDYGELAFLNATAFAGNRHLCGGATPNPCTPAATPPHLHFKLLFAICLIICFFIICAAAAAQRRGGTAPPPWTMTAFQKVSFGVTEVVESMKDGNEIGRGGSGVVYLGRSPSGEGIAVKKLSGFGTDGHDHGFRAEIRTLGRIRHRNIVRLLAICSDAVNNALVYEYMVNGSLGEALHGKKGGEINKWDRRYKIALESARGLCYLHHDCTPVIIHRDVKSNNILLDANLEAHVADFGLARFLPDGAASECVSAVAGSYGYIAPEYAYTLKVDEKSDVYSFGVVLLELITGRRPVGDFGDGVDIVQWVKKTTNNGGKQNLDVIMDSRLVSVPIDEAMHVFFIAMLCVQENSIERPTMREVVQMLSEFTRHVSTYDHISPSSSSSKQLQQTNCYKLFPDLLS